MTGKEARPASPPASILSSMLVCSAWLCTLAAKTGLFGDARGGHPQTAFEGGAPCPKDCRVHEDALSLIQSARQAGDREAPALSFVLETEREQVAAPLSLEAAMELASGSSGNLSINATDRPTVCIWPQHLQDALRSASDSVLEGLPPWPKEDDVPETMSRVTLAFLIQVSQRDRLRMLTRQFGHIYDPFDVYLYLVDEETLPTEAVKAVLPQPLPENVAVVAAAHAGYYYWPRVQVLLNGFRQLLSSQWDFVVHLSESDYPLHSLEWVRSTLAAQRRHVFVQLQPRCVLKDRRLVRSSWYWWSQNAAAATCQAAFPAHSVSSVQFPIEELDGRGLIFASASEWMILPRELVEYSTLPELDSFKRLIGMHVAADEIFWATLVLNIPGFARTINPQSWFVFRSPTNTGHSPDTLWLKHAQPILSARRMNFFVRKVDLGHSEALLDFLDEVISQPDDPPGPGDAAWDSRQHATPCSWHSVDTAGPNAYWKPPRETEVRGPFHAPAPPAESRLPAWA